MGNCDMRNELMKKAKEHTVDMNIKYSKEILNSKKATTSYTGTYMEGYTINKADIKPLNVEIVNIDTVGAVFKEAKKNTSNNIAILNFASYKYPGGMFLEGSKAQEECICHESTLFNVLRNFTDYYAYNKEHLNRALYTDRALYSPDIIFERNGEILKASVITCAAPNKTTAQKYQKVTDEENYCILDKRIKFILKIASLHNVDTLILGAWGCGVFGQEAKKVAELFKKNLEENNTFTKVLFAIPGNPDRDINYKEFISVFN